MRTAAFYGRYSCSSQTEQSIEGQLSVCSQYAKNNDIVIVDTYIDRAQTGTNDNRAEFQRMLKDSATASWDILLVYAIDRFGRNAIEVAINKQKLKTNGKVLISATQRTSDNIDGTKNLDGILLENVYIGIAEYYSAELSQKVLRGLQENLKKGLFCGGIVPYGYKVIDKVVHIDEPTANVVREIFEWYSSGKSINWIINHLHGKGIMHKGKPFLPNSIYAMLKNEKYTGVLKVKGVTYTNIYPALIDEEMFKHVKTRLDQRHFGKNHVKVDYLLKNKLVCGYCGKPISSECGKSHTGQMKYYYKCIGRKKYKNDCEKKTMRKDELEQFVIYHIIEALNAPGIKDAIVESIYSRQLQEQKAQSVLQLLNKELKQVQQSLNNVMNAIEQGVITTTTTKRLKELESKQQDLEEKIAMEKAKSILITTKDEIRNFYEKALLLEPRMLIEYLVDKIELFNDEAIIYYKNPLRTSPDDSQGFSFYNKKVKMQVYMGNKLKFEHIDMLVKMVV